MRRLTSLLLGLGLVVLCMSTALGQDEQKGKRGGRGGGGGGGALITREAVQKELKLDPEQVEKVKGIVAKVRESHRDELAKLRERDTTAEQRREISQMVMHDTNKALADVLKPEQMKRYNQIQLQVDARMQGPVVFTRPSVQKDLKLTDEQKEKIKTISDDYKKDAQALLPQGGGGRGQGRRGQGGGEAFQKVAAMSKEAMEKVQAVLTPEQKKSWKELTGETFEMPFGPGGGGGRRRGGQNQT